MVKIIFYGKISLRNLLSNRKFAWINIIGLSIGVTVSLLILLYVRYETSFEQFNPGAENIFRIVESNNQNGSIGATTPLALSDVLRKDYPEIERVVGLMRVWEPVKAGDERFDDLNGAIVEKDFFNLFNFPLQAGNPSTLFQDPYEAVITRHMATVLFGNEDPLGKTFKYGDYNFNITGIINDLPSNSIFSFDYFLSDQFRYKYYPDLSQRWYDFGLFTFVTFNGNKVPPDFEQKLTNIEMDYFPDFMKNRFKFIITSFKGSHLNPLLEGDIKPGISPGYLWILGLIAVGVLVIACLNFMNISIANAAGSNIGTAIKKVSGATSGILMRDFFSELTLLVAFSLIVSLFGVYLLLPVFNRIIEKNIAINPADPVLWTGVIGFGVFTVLVSGLYPSFVLARPSPVKVLLHDRDTGRQKMTFQKSFVVLQFIITIVLGITQLFIYKQISFMQKHDPGFDKKNLITIPVQSLGSGSGENDRLKNTTLFVQTLDKYQDQYGYGKATITEFVPGFGFRNLFRIFPEDSTYSNGLELLSCDVDENFPDVFGLHIINGRYFSRDYSTDYNEAIVINEAAFRALGWRSVEDKSVGLFDINNRKRVVGVINDINIRSLQFPIGPMIYQFGDHHNYPGYITLRISDIRKAETIGFFRDRWTELFPGIPFKYESVDEKYNSFYGAEKKIARITGSFTILAMILSLLGIFALSILEADKRTKEIGIRKISGAKSGEIIVMLNRYFIRWIAIAFAIGIPVAAYITQRWLQNYAFRTSVSWWIFAFAGMIILATAVLTITWQSWRAAIRNPVEALRYE
jgi:putative ABC transport system permease protein